MVHPLEFFLSYLEGFPGVSAGKESACNAGDLGLIPGLGRSPGEGKGHPLQYSGLESSVDCVVHGVAKTLIRLSDFYLLWRSRGGGRGKLFLKGKLPGALVVWISSYQIRGARFSPSFGNKNLGSHALQSKKFLNA